MMNTENGDVITHRMLATTHKNAASPSPSGHENFRGSIRSLHGDERSYSALTAPRILKKMTCASARKPSARALPVGVSRSAIVAGARANL
eukprot:29974-Pelagococcus_subviridis.AAC.10